jgi:hypothetical protein
VTPGAIRKRRSRTKLRAGYQSYRLYLPKKIIRAVQVRENFPADKIPSKRQIERTLVSALDWWAGSWIGLRKKKSHGTDQA